ncbi:hypothetical protein BO86DRAFT_394625 [Aspergillus japonicus CBS 114.51]|uniref:Uncharacterized protein n=1 Tax=Aspergillus japonicus CBS 114.51 TaxID=1448312 RepID=A0A8T8XHG5_ASPJA|nr:hypothetical protein BO86DRAFT_394625 [Aspergillus japonicus CBS 114.51]RAH86829.1 hypothetical protein BO86DRAFT_394625 [Aspergillus japonicus CBS 114.51]
MSPRTLDSTLNKRYTTHYHDTERETEEPVFVSLRLRVFDISKELHSPDCPSYKSSQPEQPNLAEAEETENEEDYPIVRLPYNEDTVVALVSDIYRIYVQLGYMNNRADGMEELVWPPPEGHSINAALCEELNLSPRAISLMRRLPYPVSIGIAANTPFLPRSTAFTYIEDRQIRDGREPGRRIFDELRKDFLLPHEIALAGADDEGIHISLIQKKVCVMLSFLGAMLSFGSRIQEQKYLLTILDTIRAPDWEELELEDEDGNFIFRSLPSHHALTFLVEYVNKLRSLEIIPGGQEGRGRFYDVHYGKLEQYGWPYDFRETEWKAAARDTLQRLERLYPFY